MIVEAIIAGFVAGLFGAIVGLGGGVVLVPMLTLIFDVPMSQAVPASLVGVVATAMGGTTKFLFDGHTDVDLAVKAGCVTALGAMIGARIGGYLPDRALETGFALLLFLILWRLSAQRKADPKNASAPSQALAISMFSGSGLLSGLLGVGGGVLNVPALRLVLKKDMLTAVATSTMIISFTASAGAAVYASAGIMNWSLATGCATGAFAGGRLGALLAPRVSGQTLQRIFLIVIFYVAIEMLAHGLELPWWR
jgi:uncharacterized membrane protein YfcA